MPVSLHAADVRGVACLTWQFPDGSMRYSCGPASSYAARRVDVPKGLRVNIVRTAIRSRMPKVEQRLHQKILHVLHGVPKHPPGIPIKVEDMHEAGDSVCQDLPRDAVAIKAAAAMKGSVSISYNALEELMISEAH